jgi:hypothetical protein
MFLSLMLHLLDLLECLITKVFALANIISLIITQIALIAESGDFRAINLLEELLLKYVIQLEADLEFLAPITSILDIFLQLLSLSFRFPCSINPNAINAPCGIDGFDIGSMVSGAIAQQVDGKYQFDSKYLIPICQPFTEVSSDAVIPPSYNSATEPVRDALAFNGTNSVNNNLFDISYFNPNTKRKKELGFDPDTENIKSISTDSYVSLVSYYTKRRKSFESSQASIFEFNGRTWKSLISSFDKQIIDEKQAFDTPITLLKKSGSSLYVPSDSGTGSFHSMIDGKSLITDPISIGGGIKASVKPLVLDIVQNGETVERTFESIPAMVVLDQDFNVYAINEDGIIFSEYKDLSGNSVLAVSEIIATILNKQSSTVDAFDKEDEVTGVDSSGNPVTQSIFSLPQLYFVDTRVAAESIQSKCQTVSINQLPLDETDDGSGEVKKVTDCLKEFLDAIKSQTSAIKNSLSVGEVPVQINKTKIEESYVVLGVCIESAISNVCSIVTNPLNTSFKLMEDNDLTPILPDPASLPTDILSGFESSGPSFTGAREYAGGIGDSETVLVGNAATILIIPRDSYDNVIYMDMSDKILIEIVSDTTGSARFQMYPTESNSNNIFVHNEADRSYTAKLYSSNPGEVKIKASICSKPIQALTYSDLIPQTDSSGTGCITDPAASTLVPGTPLGALARINRILTINFIDVSKNIVVENITGSGIITDPQVFASGLEN